MSRKKQQSAKRKQQHRAGNRGPAPMLFKQSVTLTDTFEVSSPDNFTSGGALMRVNPNGSAQPFGVNVGVPQVGIFDQYAAMFDFYQVKRIHAKFIPYKAQFALPTTITDPVIFGQPSFSIIDPDNTFPSNTSTAIQQLFAYGNCISTDAYHTVNRSMNVYTNLAIQKQGSTILKTNGSAAARQLYDNPAGIVIYAQAPQRTENALVGRFVFSLEYEFSGRRDPLGPENRHLIPSADDGLPDALIVGRVSHAAKEPQDPTITKSIVSAIPPKPPAGEHNDMYAQFLKFKAEK